MDTLSVSKGAIILRSKIFWKFYFAFLVLVFVSLLSSYFFLKSYFKETHIKQTAQSLDQLLVLVIKSLEEQKINHWLPETLEPLVDHLAAGGIYRITLISPQGKVLADSEVSGQKLAELENHSKRPEVQEALQKGWGESLRYSTSVQKDMLYVARPFPGGVIRISMPLVFLSHSLNELKSVLFYGLWVGGIISAFLSLWVARRFSKPLQDLTISAQAMTRGDFQRRVPVRGRDELATLARSFNELALILGDLVEKLSEEKKQLRITLDSMVEGVIVLDAAGKIILSNPAFRHMFDFSHPPEGYSPIELFRNSDLQDIVDCVIAGKECKNCEIEIQREGIQYFMVQGAPLLSELGKWKANSGKAIAVEGATQAPDYVSEGSVLVFYDITSLRHLEKVRKDFVANVSHELKTPLTAIKGYAETLLSGALEDKENAPKFLKIIDQHADRLNRIVSDLLDLSKIESEQYKLYFEKVNLPVLMEELKLTFEKSLKAKKITLNIQEGSIESLFADIAAIRQILSNLFDNAIKYSQEGGQVEVKFLLQEGKILFSVKDTGSGILPEHLPRIFERFYRVDPSRSRAQGGTGLGLSIVKHLVQLHGGEIWVESTLGEGSTFFFTIPAN